MSLLKIFYFVLVFRKDELVESSSQIDLRIFCVLENCSRVLETLRVLLSDWEKRSLMVEALKMILATVDLADLSRNVIECRSIDFWIDREGKTFLRQFNVIVGFVFGAPGSRDFSVPSEMLTNVKKKEIILSVLVCDEKW